MAEGVLEGLAVGAGEIQHPEADRVAPRLMASLEPAAGAGSATTGDDVEQLAVPGADIDDRRAPGLGPPAALSAEQGLIQPERLDLADPVGVFDQWCAVGDDRLVHGVPVTAQLPGHLGDGAAQTADLLAHPAARSIGHGLTGARDPRVLAGPRAQGTAVIGATPAMLVPHQPRRPTEARQVHQHDRGPILHPRPRPAPPTARPRQARLAMPDHRVLVLSVDAEHVHRRQAHQQLAHARRCGLHRGSPARLASEPPDSQSPCAASGGPSARSHTPLRSEAPVFACLRTDGNVAVVGCSANSTTACSKEHW
jgi:hypothetical protein